jgi:hypothetical protein
MKTLIHCVFMKKNAARILGYVASVLLPVAGVSAVRGATVTAQWNFDDAAAVGGSVSNVGGFSGTFTGVAGRTASGGGVSGTAGDYAFDPRAQANNANGAMTSNTPAFLSALNTVTGSQALSITFWEFLDSTPSATAFWGNSPSIAGAGGQRGLNAHTPWSDGNLYFDTSGCCDGTNRISGALGATLGDWQFITLVYNAGTRQAYRNNTLVASGSGGLALVSDINAFIVGNDNTLTNLGMDAKLDNFTIWSGALTTPEIAALAVRPVPEPSAWMLAMLGAFAISRRRVRR